MRITLALAALTAACTQTPANCPDDAALARIEAARFTETLRACDGQHYDTCLERVKIDKRYNAMRDAWVRCEEVTTP